MSIGFIAALRCTTLTQADVPGVWSLMPLAYRLRLADLPSASLRYAWLNFEPNSSSPASLVTPCQLAYRDHLLDCRTFRRNGSSGIDGGNLILEKS